MAPDMKSGAIEGQGLLGFDEIDLELGTLRSDGA
jgi:hypothetical protein